MGRSFTGRVLKPVELEIELFCRGLRFDESVLTGGDTRPINRTRAGLGSGLEMVLIGRPKNIWVNVPVLERFAQQSPFVLLRRDESLFVRDERDQHEYPVLIPPEPRWYSRYK